MDKIKRSREFVKPSDSLPTEYGADLFIDFYWQRLKLLLTVILFSGLIGGILTLIVSMVRLFSRP